MDLSQFLIECLMALVAGCLGASISGLGGFVLLGITGVTSFLYLLVTGQDPLMLAAAGGILLKPSSCFLGAVIAAAYARKKGLMQCGKDIGRPLLSFKRFDVLAVGSIAGLAGYLLNFAFDRFLTGRINTIPLTVFVVSVFIKFLWNMRITSDCAASSHAVPSPFRFFEKLQTPVAKIILPMVVGALSALIVLACSFNSQAAPYASLFVFCLSALSLFFLFFAIQIPVSHHYSGPAGAIVAFIISERGIATDPLYIALLGLWGIFAAQLGSLAGEIMGRLFFDEGDIHIDPPAMGIMVSSLVMFTLFPAMGVFSWSIAMQCLFCAGGTIAVVLLKLTPLMNHKKLA